MFIKKVIILFNIFVLSAIISPRLACAQTTEGGESDMLQGRIIINVENMPNYRQVLRDTVTTFKKFAKERNPDFLIVVREGTDLFVRGKWENQYQQLKNAERGLTNMDDLLQERSSALPPVGMPNRNYLRTVDAVIFDDHYCGENQTDEFAKVAIENYRIPILALDKCENYEMAMNAVQAAKKDGIILYPDIDPSYKIEDELTKQKKRRLLEKHKPKKRSADEYSDVPKKVYNDLSSKNIMSLYDAKNMLFNTNTIKYKKKEKWLGDLRDTNYDMIIINPLFNDEDPLSADDIYSIKFKKLGAKRLVLAYINISRAKDTMPYWKDHWTLGRPSWLRSIAQDAQGEMIVDYWHPDWRSIIGRYFNNFLTLGFDGVVIDGLGAHAFFEELTPIE